MDLQGHKREEFNDIFRGATKFLAKIFEDN